MYSTVRSHPAMKAPPHPLRSTDPRCRGLLTVFLSFGRNDADTPSFLSPSKASVCGGHRQGLGLCVRPTELCRCEPAERCETGTGVCPCSYQLHLFAHLRYSDTFECARYLQSYTSLASVNYSGDVFCKADGKLFLPWLPPPTHTVKSPIGITVLVRRAFRTHAPVCKGMGASLCVYYVI